jgi:hypothetical protein
MMSKVKVTARPSDMALSGEKREDEPLEMTQIVNIGPWSFSSMAEGSG